ncbi:ectonucleotide pyrophosphatase/phosphodiesterase family member 7-like [Boleophthalmus pectinirostris]|uniref:ectonucleotide pyrophosphatase/phosphodiesterase family member 7-like n=1 Tax=Boleophthalmus pectinirostris TaxID=150288 RepID=UPI002431DFF5|nr:ectonucleotide pyrophosphatase/phosphodiesterase family member 7-like [Boleophthalmus pectinirostris]
MRAPVVLGLLWASVALASPVSRQRQKLLLISFDGFRWDYDRYVDTPNLDQMVKDGVKAQYVTPPYLTITSPTHFTLLTGLYVENHGVIHNMFFDPVTSQKLPYYQTQFKNEWWDNGPLPIWITAQRQGLKAGSLHFPGTASTYNGESASVREVEPSMYNYKNETAWRENTDKVMSWFKDQDLDFVSMYFGEPDGTGHRYGPNSPEVHEMVKQVDRTVGYIRQTAKNYGLEDRLNIIITADHGMTQVVQNGLQEITLSKIPGFSFQDVSFYLLDYGPSGMILPKPGMLEKVYNALKGANPHLHVYKKEELPERMHFTKSERILPIILWADPGYVINSRIGLYVENHGVIHNMFFDPVTSQKLPYYQTQFKNEWWDNGPLPIWITAQRQGLKAGSLHFPGTASTYNGESASVREVEPSMYNYKNETAWRENTDKVMSWFKDQDLDFVSMYFGEPDGTGHRYGPNSPEVHEMVKQVDRTVGYIRQTAKNYGLEDRLNIIITADHGMTQVVQNGLQEITLSKIPGFSFQDVSFYLLDYGPSGMILPKPGMLEKVYNALKGANPHLHVYKKEELPERMHFTKSERILPIILWADPGYVINSYFPVQFHKGEHGFDNAEMDMKAFFRAVGPAFHQNLEVGPFETVNIYPLMCHILGITPEKNDGSLEVTRHMLRSEGGGGGLRAGQVRAVNYLNKALVGLGAMGVFLVIVAILFLANRYLKKKKKRSQNRRDVRVEEEVKDEDEAKYSGDERDDKQTAF